ncbi:type II toxin-antitoxin system RelE/ParE family toxin [Frateuria soli]|uniref:type II toxin-antitoxin system RelE/ParE family toxin n=1 Tax=Frateuria soli TaxID=1542730 RepID=UPI001E5F7BA6|nr:type II toxin-antitoxin system RelE/ParE family toxin [Frateuria soli]UGB36875.1 type II toxin-antitoxin system RelE/ParE family toxin [Frateuria soli]
MSHQLRFAEAALRDIERLYRFLADQDIPAAEAALDALDKGWGLLSRFPFSARKADPANPFLRELLIPFGGAGYVALFEITDSTIVTILAVRHQREDDYH